ncbi:hypothetical protein K6102_07375 [Vibrio furnissii]|uniref:hypothetical protein n=1 Tax=Vibrio furnissii TaxID=29494 RepID=UPI001EEA665C|nr:hypothetical protein [Vibrio furnissii]MCG6232844.1 hypothetical protein [Vibrio furnissii]
MDKLSEWLTSGEYLPHFMRDFHDQKDVFKAMHNTIHNADENGNPRDGHIYVVDTFLWYMARCGYTLQMSRKDVPLKNMQDDIDRYKAEISSKFAEVISEK